MKWLLMVKVMKRWNRQERKNLKVSSKPLKSKLAEPISEEFKIQRVYIRKRKPKHQGYTLMNKINYGYFNKDAFKPRK